MPPLRGEVARRSRDGRVGFREPQPLRRCEPAPLTQGSLSTPLTHYDGSYPRSAHPMPPLSEGAHDPHNIIYL